MERRTRFFLISLFFSISVVHAEKLSLPVAGLFVPHESNVRADFEWNEKWFGEKSSFVYNHNLARIAILFSQLSYSDIEEKQYDSAIVEAYEALGVQRQNIDLHYDIDIDDENFGIDQCAFSFACKEIDSYYGKKQLVFVVVRGTVVNFHEWMSNLNVSNNTRKVPVYHEGFNKCAQQVMNELFFFLEKHNIDLDDTFFLVTGHSRGAAVANLVGAHMCDTGYFDTARLHVYTFATPNVTTSKKVDNLKYGFIFNILNDEDLVPMIPLTKNWGFRRFGRDMMTVSLWNSRGTEFENEYVPRMNEYYKKFMGRTYVTSNTGSFVPGFTVELLSNNFKDIESYYREKTGFKALTEQMLKRVLPPEKKLSIDDVVRSTKKFKVAGPLERKIDEIVNRTFDMHVGESYLSWLLALNENELYQDVGSVRITFKGNFDLAVFDENNTVVAKVMDGYTQMKSSKVPVGVLTVPGSTVLGFPANRNFTVAIYKDTIIPTPVHLKVENLDVQANVVSESEFDPEATEETDFTLLPKVGIVYVFDAGKKSFSEKSLRFRIFKDKLKAKILDDGKLDQFRYFRFQPEINFGTDFFNKYNFELGFHAGTRIVYGSVLFSFPEGGFQLSPGLGHEQPIFNRIMLNIEVFERMRWFKSSGFRFLPSSRISISYKPVHYFQIFAAYDLAFNVKDLEFEHLFKCGLKF